MGLNQADTGLNPDIDYAAEAENVETHNGVLQPQAAIPEYVGTFASKVETLIDFHRRWYEGDGSNTWYVCCAGGKFYEKQAGNDIGWLEIQLPTGIVAYEKSEWSWVIYESSESGDTVDIILLSNDKDGMIMIIPPDRPTIHNDLAEFTHEALAAFTHDELSSPRWSIRSVETRGEKFGVIERFNERVWGGAIPGKPDTLMYSAVYHPDDWRMYTPDPDPTDPYQTEGQPEDGSGDVNQPSWDGDKFFALKKFGDRLLAFKKNTIWQVIGVSPGEFQFNEQYGGGTNYYKTIAVDKEKVLMGSNDGLMIYDGMSASPYAWQQIEQVWQIVNRDALGEMCGALHKDRYYLAFPTGNSDHNNAMLVYNMTERTILFYPGICVERFLPTDDVLFITTSTLPGKILRLQYNSWDVKQASGAATKWVSPWMDFGYKRIQKGGFDLYFVPEVQDEAVTLKFSIQTEKKLKTKTYTVQPLTEEQRATPKEHRGKRLHFGGMGRKFRLIIETDEGVTAPWRLIGGIQMVVETDPD